MNIIEKLEQEELARVSANRAIPDFAPGDTVIVNVNVVEGNRKRVQAYEGVVIGRRNRGLNSSFVDVRRAKLYYLRDRSGKSARIREKLSHKSAADKAAADKAAAVEASE